MEVLLRTTIWNRRIPWSCFFIYHVHRPTQVKEIIKSYSVEPKIAVGKNIKSLLLKGFELKPADDFLKAAKLMRCCIGLAAKEIFNRIFL
jgi:hypothetical protein